MKITISYKESTNTTVVTLGNGTVGIGSIDNCLLFKALKGDEGPLHKDEVKAADIMIEINTLDNIRCFRDRLNEIETFLTKKEI